MLCPMGRNLLVLGCETLAPDLPRIFLDFAVHVESMFDGAIDALGRVAQDAVVLGLDFDYGRPLRILRHIREHEQFTPIPVVAVDVDGRTNEKTDPTNAYHGLGADDFFHLPRTIRVEGRDAALAQLRSRVLWRLSAGSAVARTAKPLFIDASTSQIEPAYLGSALQRIGLGGFFARCRHCRSEHFVLAEPADPVTTLSELICAVCEAVTTQGELIVQIGKDALAAARQRLDDVGC